MDWCPRDGLLVRRSLLLFFASELRYRQAYHRPFSSSYSLSSSVFSSRLKQILVLNPPSILTGPTFAHRLITPHQQRPRFLFPPLSLPFPPTTTINPLPTFHLHPSASSTLLSCTPPPPLPPTVNFTRSIRSRQEIMDHRRELARLEREDTQSSLDLGRRSWREDERATDKVSQVESLSFCVERLTTRRKCVF